MGKTTFSLSTRQERALRDLQQFVPWSMEQLVRYALDNLVERTEAGLDRMLRFWRQVDRSGDCFMQPHACSRRLTMPRFGGVTLREGYPSKPLPQSSEQVRPT